MSKMNDMVGDAMLNAYAGIFGAGSVLELREGEEVVAQIKLPEIPWGAPQDQSIDVNGGWNGTAVKDGTVDNFVLRSPLGHVDEGSVSRDGGDMRLDNPVLAKGQSVLINSFRKELAE